MCAPAFGLTAEGSGLPPPDSARHQGNDRSSLHSDVPGNCPLPARAVVPTTVFRTKLLAAPFCAACGHRLVGEMATAAALADMPPPFTAAPASAPSYAPPPGYPPPLSYPPPYPPPPTTKSNGMAIASLVLGILWLGGLGSLLALIFGIIGKNQIDRSGGYQSGRGMAIAGIVLGIVGLAGAILWFTLAVIAANSVNNGYGY